MSQLQTATKTRVRGIYMGMPPTPVPALTALPARTVERKPLRDAGQDGRCRTRTCGHLRVRQALYQLS